MHISLMLQVHNTNRTNQQRGMDLAAAALDNDHQTPDQDRELRYYLAGVLSTSSSQLNFFYSSRIFHSSRINSSTSMGCA
jgi:hypothetical protein